MTWERTRATPEYSRQLLELRLKHYSRHGFGIMAIEDANAVLVGQAGLQVLHDIGREQIEFVVFLSPHLVGTGLGTILGEYFTTLSRQCRLSEIYATVRPENAAAERLIRKLGFKYAADAVHFGMPCSLWRLGLEGPLPKNGGLRH